MRPYYDEVVKADPSLRTPLDQLQQYGLAEALPGKQVNWTEAGYDLLELCGTHVRELREKAGLSQNELILHFRIWRDDALRRCNGATVSRRETALRDKYNDRNDTAPTIFFPEELAKLAEFFETALRQQPGAQSLNGLHPVFHFFHFGVDAFVPNRVRVEEHYRPALLANNIVREVGTMLNQKYFRAPRLNGQPVEFNADKVAFDLICRRIRDAFGKDEMIIGEEVKDEVDFDTIPNGTRLWVADSIDATLNFRNRLPIWCVSLSCGRWDEKKQTLIPNGAAIYHPGSDELYFGMICNGSGAAYLQRGTHIERLEVSDEEDINDSLIATHLSSQRDVREQYISSGLLTDLLDHCARIELLGCGQISLAYVALGGYAGFVQPRTPWWDVIAGKTIIEAAANCDPARGLVRDFHNPDLEWTFRSEGVIAACNKVIFQQLKSMKRAWWESKGQVATR